MTKRNTLTLILTLRQGHMYVRAAGSKVTYVPVVNVESYVHQCLANPLLRGQISLSHVKQLITLLQHPNFAMRPQLQIDHDLIEVNGGKCWHLASMKFVDTPIPPDMVGRISPRAFFPVDLYMVPDPTHFKETINNSFPDRAQQTMFLLKWYQLLFGHRHQMKTPCLLVYGVKDCGKTSIANPILEVSSCLPSTPVCAPLLTIHE